MSSSRRTRSHRDISGNVDDEDDSDSDDDLFTPVFAATSRSSQRKSAKDAEAKKQKRMAQMSALLDNGMMKFERESRIDEIHQQNREILLDEDLEEKEADRNYSGGGSKPGDSHNYSISHVSGAKRGGLDKHQDIENESYVLNQQPRDTKETFCLGSRKTLRFSRFISSATTDESERSPSSTSTDDNQSLCVSTVWSSFEEALATFRTILLIDRQQQQQSSPFASLREKLLQSRVTKSHHVCRMYLQKRLMCKQDHPEQIRRIPIDVLRWLMTLACGPVANGSSNDNNINNKINTAESLKGVASTKQSTRLRTAKVAENENGSSKTNSEVSLRFWRDAQMGSYQTLYHLWSHESGFPLQQEQSKEVYLLSISTLPRQLGQWFGLTLPLDSTGEISGNNDKTEDRNWSDLSSESALASSSSSTPPATNAVDENKKDLIHVTNDRTALIRFLQLWALALRQQNDCNGSKGNVHLVDFSYDKDNCENFQNDVSNAIMAVLWVGLDPEFASSESAKDDCNKSVQTIVQCLLDKVRREASAHDQRINREDGDVRVSYEQWLLNLSERICSTWSKKLGRGQKGTDAYEDEHAWLCLARTVACLGNIDNDFEQENSGSCSHLKVHENRERAMTPSLKDLQLTLFRSILNRAFGCERDRDSTQHVNENREERPIGICNTDDWVSRSVEEEMESLSIPGEVRASQSWQALTLSSIGLAKLATSFPEDEASKCFALMDTCTVCFRLGIVDLQKKTRNGCLKEPKEEDFEEHDDVHISNNTSTTDPSKIGIEDEVLEKHALYNAFERLESLAQIISNKTRALIMQNICFPWASHMAESMRNYARLQKGAFAPTSIKNTVAPMRLQAKINSFFESDKPSPN